MSLLPEGQPLDKALPDLSELLEDPHAYLSEAPLAIGPRRMYHLSALFAIPGLALLSWCIWESKFQDERFLLGIGLLVGASVWLGWSLLLRGHELVCYPDGLEVIHHNKSIWAPWALFHHGEGAVRPFVPPSDSPSAGLMLPINPQVLPYVELRQGGVTIAWGRKATGPQWQYTSTDEVVLPARYQIASEDIGELLLVLGNRLGKELPRTPVVKELQEAIPTVRTTDPSDWITMPLTRLHLPACCARCAGPQDAFLHQRVSSAGDWLLMGVGVGTFRPLEVRVPVCEECKADIESRQRAGTTVGLVVGAALGIGVGVSLGGWLGDGKDVGFVVGGFAGLFLGVLIGTTVAMVLSRKLPIRIRGYSPARGLVSVKFENPLIAARVLEASRLRDERAKRFSQDATEGW